MGLPLKKPSPQISEAMGNQISVLKALSNHPTPLKDVKLYQLNEIAELTGFTDEREIQRYLFILEGHKLVAPHPDGDLTSKNWQITKTWYQGHPQHRKALPR